MAKRNSMAAVFEQHVEEGESLSSQPTAAQERVLSDLPSRVAALAASLGVSVTPTGNAPYDPDVFVAVVTRARDDLQRVRTLLEEQNARQQAREALLDEREAAVRFREQRMNAYDTLIPSSSPPSRPWWRVW